MDYLEKAEELLYLYHIQNKTLAADIAIMVVEAEKKLLDKLKGNK